MSESHILLSLGGIGAAALASQWLAWRLRLPAILFLLLCGILAGPLLGWLHPDALFGPLLFPLVSPGCPCLRPILTSALKRQQSEITRKTIKKRSDNSVAQHAQRFSSAHPSRCAPPDHPQH